MSEMPVAARDVGTMDALSESILRWARQITCWDVAWETGVYPAEMAAFLGLCEHRGVRGIVESGRGVHAYSTRILGEYAQRTGTPVVSIDLGIHRTPYEDRLRAYRHLRCLVGDTFKVFPQAVAGLTPPVAVLLDGPKLRAANQLSLVASCLYDVAVVAHHNCPLSSDWGQEFGRVFPGAFHYEMLPLSADPAWQDFKEWERSVVNASGAVLHPDRLLNASTLALASVPQRRLFPELFGLGGGLPRGIRLWLGWSAQNAALRLRRAHPAASS